MQPMAAISFGQVLLTVLEVALLALWIWVAISVVIDIFRSPDLSGAAKAGWVLVVMVIPLLGVLIYIIARGDKMKQHEIVAQVEDGATMAEKDFQRARKNAEKTAGQQRDQATRSSSARA